MATHLFQGPRAQVDRKLYKRHMQKALHDYPNLDIRSASVHDLIFDNETTTNNAWGKVVGVRLGMIISTNKVYTMLISVADQNPEKLSLAHKQSSAREPSYPARFISVRASWSWRSNYRTNNAKSECIRRNETISCWPHE